MMMVTIHHPPFTIHFFRWFVLCLLVCIPAGAIAGAIDRDAADLMRASLAGEPIPQSGSLDLVEWKAFAFALEIKSTDEREQALRDIYKKTDSIYLRSVILEAISEDPRFRSRQARFIRRYGFYANWFNRLMITFTETLQGRIQAVGQLVIDAANDLVRPAEADPLERRAYELALQSESTNSPSARAQMETLRKRVDRARAVDDLDRAQWALDQDDPESAEFYASQALVERPGWGSAERLRLRAAGKTAENNRRALASTQVGYPDRNPPVRPTDADLARSILVPKSSTPKDSAEARLATDLASWLPQNPDRGRARMMRDWQGALDRNPDAPEDARRWTRAMIDDPDHNPDRRLDQASSHRRGQLMKYILIGPDTARRRTYKAASWATQTYQAMQNIGVFFVFEVMGRAVQSAFSPPVPAEAVRDARAAWLADAPDPQSDEARELAKALAKADERDGRFNDARARLAAAGLLDAKKKQKLDKAEAKRFARLAEENPESSSTLAARALALDPNVKIKPKKQKPKKEQSKWHLDWETLAGWSGQRLPAGLPGSPEWFDGKPENGEITADGLWFERPDPRDRDRLTLRYTIQYPNERRVFQQEVRAARLPERVRNWLGFSGALGDESREKLRRLKRLPIPMALEGGAGMSGIDFHPRLMPIETRPGELELYR